MHHDETPDRVATDDHGRLLYIYTAHARKLAKFDAADRPRRPERLRGLPGYTDTPVLHRPAVPAEIVVGAMYNRPDWTAYERSRSEMATWS